MDMDTDVTVVVAPRGGHVKLGVTVVVAVGAEAVIVVVAVQLSWVFA
jgi:hypothetical protein